MAKHIFLASVVALLVPGLAGHAQAQVGQQRCAACSIEVVINTNAHLDSLTQAEFSCFIATFDPSCGVNAEYSEFSNEVLFKVLLSHPGYLVRYVEDDSEPMKTQYVLSQLSAPVTDEFCPQECIRSITNASGAVGAKDRILQALRNIPPIR